ncbi:MAG TPA: amino acid ABC transporter substrate-binding protein, partial [Alphaproteobacteria bacterium]|nr:amino acid ABC transporter substrate-binding protein [Alphaproteobacteria bacterium]
MSTQFKAIIAVILVIAVAAGAYFYLQKEDQTGDTILLGAAVSLTGKYSTNGKHTQQGYNLAVNRINERGGV